MTFIIFFLLNKFHIKSKGQTCASYRQIHLISIELINLIASKMLLNIFSTVCTNNGNMLYITSHTESIQTLQKTCSI